MKEEKKNQHGFLALTTSNTRSYTYNQSFDFVCITYLKNIIVKRIPNEQQH